MKKSKIAAAILIAAITMGIFGVGAYAFRGSGIEVMSRDVTVIKTGLLGRKLTFSDVDFKSAYSITDFEKISVTALPSSNEGTLLLAGRRVGEGQEIKRRNIAAMVFVPAGKDIKEASFRFTLDGGEESVCTMRFIDKINYAPKSEDASGASVQTAVTQEEISVYGKMLGCDPEGDKIEYIVVSYPESGILTVTDSESGSYRYTPISGFTGYDEFVYVVRDEWGNYSEPKEVSLKVIDRMSDAVYLDMIDSPEYNAAVAMEAMGIMTGKLVGDDRYFEPEKTVSRAEFVAMAMKAMGIKRDASVSQSYFDDNRDIPASLVGYVARAQRLGIIDGEYKNSRLTFSPNKEITVYEAASIMSRLLGGAGAEDEVYSDMSEVPVWARGDVMAMVTLGIIDEADISMTASVNRATAAEFLYRMVNNS